MAEGNLPDSNSRIGLALELEGPEYKNIYDQLKEQSSNGKLCQIRKTRYDRWFCSNGHKHSTDASYDPNGAVCMQIVSRFDFPSFQTMYWNTFDSRPPQSIDDLDKLIDQADDKFFNKLAELKDLAMVEEYCESCEYRTCPQIGYYIAEKLSDGTVKPVQKDDLKFWTHTMAEIHANMLGYEIDSGHKTVPTNGAISKLIGVDGKQDRMLC